jgi:hypothetical protein
MKFSEFFFEALFFVDVFLVFLGGFCLPQLDPEKRSATEMVGSHWSARRLDKVTRSRKR